MEPSMRHDHLFTYDLKEQEDGRWSAVCNQLPGVATYGADKVDAIRLLADALEGAIRVYEAKGWPIPAVSGPGAVHEDHGYVLVP